MGKVILFLSAVGMSLLFICGIFFPDSPIMWLADTSPLFAALRAVLIVVLVGLLVTTPPRNVYFRTLVGMATLGVMAWIIPATYNNQMLWIDSLSLMSASLAAFIAALERGWEERYGQLHTVLQPEPHIHRLPIWKNERFKL